MNILGNFKRFSNHQGVANAMTKETASPLFMHAIALVLLVASLLLYVLPHVSYADEHETPGSANICSDQSENARIVAYELSWNVKLALGNKMLFSPDSFRDAATSDFGDATVVNAFPPDILRESVNLNDEDFDELGESWFAIFDLADDDTPWYEAPSYAAYPVSFDDVQSYVAVEETQECNVYHLGYLVNLDTTPSEALEVNASEFILLPGLAE